MATRRTTPFIDNKRKFEYCLPDEHSFSRFVLASSEDEALSLIQDRHTDENPASINIRDAEQFLQEEKAYCEAFFKAYTKEAFLKRLAHELYDGVMQHHFHDGVSQIYLAPAPLLFTRIEDYDVDKIFRFVKAHKELFDDESRGFVDYFESDIGARLAYEFRSKGGKVEIDGGKHSLFVLELLESAWPYKKYRICRVFENSLFLDLLNEAKKIAESEGKIASIRIGVTEYAMTDNYKIPERYDEYNFDMSESPLGILWAESKPYERFELKEGIEFTLDASDTRYKLSQELAEKFSPLFEIVFEISDEPINREKPVQPAVEEESTPKKAGDHSKLKAFLLSSALILIPYSLFALSLFLLFRIHSGIMMPYIPPDGFVLFAVFSMMALIIGSTIISPLDLTIRVVADIQTPSGAYEITEIGTGNYDIAERGSAGVGIIILKFIVNILISPFMIIYWLIVFVLILTKDGFAKKYLGDIEEKGKAIASGVMLVGVVLASVETGCVNARAEEYSPGKFEMTASSLVLKQRQTYGDGSITDTYDFEISFYHPRMDALESIEGRGATVFYDGREVDSEALSVTANKYFYKWSDAKIIHCALYNTYGENDAIKLDEIDKSKLEIIYHLSYVSFGQDKYSYIRFESETISVRCRF